jgi:glycosyltransferase involved in cell wall biosynthesis
MSTINDLFPRVAIVADQMTGFGGADREMISILKLFPDADIFTIYFDKTKYPQIKNNVHTSFVQKIFKFLPKNFSKHLKIFTPWAYESFSFHGYDLVISISAGPAKGIITDIYQPHVAMTMTPPRSLWDKEYNFRGYKLKGFYKAISENINTFMRLWDISIAKRVDYWTANSKYIQTKIKKTYNVDSTVIYPGVDEKYFIKPEQTVCTGVMEKYNLPSDFVLVVSRLYDYKRVDWAIDACIKIKKNLVIVGEGPDMNFLKKKAGGSEYIKFLGYIPDDEVICLLYKAKLLLFCGLEDFGIVPVEAMAAGTPVFALREGGVLETVKEGICGEFFETREELVILLKNFEKRRYNGKKIKEHAQKFSEEKFIHNLEEYLRNVYEEKAKK